MVLSVFLFRQPKSESRNTSSLAEIVRRLDPWGTVSSIAGLILLVFSLTSGNQYGWSSATTLAPLIIAVVLLVVFVVVEIKVSTFPLVPRSLQSSNTLQLSCAMAALTYGVWQGANYVLTLELQGTHLSTATNFGVGTGTGTNEHVYQSIRSWIFISSNRHPFSSSRRYGSPSEHDRPTSPPTRRHPLASSYSLDSRPGRSTASSLYRQEIRLLALLLPRHDPVHRGRWHSLFCFNGHGDRVDAQGASWIRSRGL